MAEIRTVTTLRRKREEIRRTIIAYEERLSQARADLAHITAAISVFEGSGDTADKRAYVDVYRVFKRHEPIELAKRALAENGPLDTRELARYLMAAKGLDPSDKVLAKSIAAKLITPSASRCGGASWSQSGSVTRRRYGRCRTT